MFLFSFSGCGYKKPPYYIDAPPSADDNVEFIIKEK